MNLLVSQQIGFSLENDKAYCIKISMFRFSIGHHPSQQHTVTTGGRQFAVCQRHTAKGEKLTAKGLPCAAHGKQHTANRCRQRGHLLCAIYRAHSKLFAVWFVALGKQILKE